MEKEDDDGSLSFLKIPEQDGNKQFHGKEISQSELKIKIMNITHSNDKPQVWSAVGNGSYFYRFNIKEIEVPAQTEGAEVTKAWQYNEVVVWGPVTSDVVTKEVMNAMWSKDAEQKMLNDYNAAQLGILGDEYVNIYKDFLTARKAIKAQIDADFLTFKF